MFSETLIDWLAWSLTSDIAEQQALDSGFTITAEAPKVIELLGGVTCVGRVLRPELRSSAIYQASSSNKINTMSIVLVIGVGGGSLFVITVMVMMLLWLWRKTKNITKVSDVSYFIPYGELVFKDEMGQGSFGTVSW
jgi:hypothetical protein